MIALGYQNPSRIKRRNQQSTHGGKTWMRFHSSPSKSIAGASRSGLPPPAMRPSPEFPGNLREKRGSRQARPSRVKTAFMTQLFPAAAPDVLYIVDLSSYMLRAYHAIAPLSSPSGEPTHAVHGTVSMLERLVRQCRPALLAIAMDSGRATFRKEIYDAYKANRPPAPQDLKQQMARCEQIVRAFNIPIFKQDGVEADDLIASAVKRAADHELKVVIVAADKDLMQLVSDTVVMWDTMRDRVFGVPEVEERFGVRVDQLRDLLALTGDTSDNIPGVPSVGPKTAKELLVEFGSIDGIYGGVEQLKKKGTTRQARRTSRAGVFESTARHAQGRLPHHD